MKYTDEQKDRIIEAAQNLAEELGRTNTTYAFTQLIDLMKALHPTQEPDWSKARLGDCVAWINNGDTADFILYHPETSEVTVRCNGAALETWDTQNCTYEPRHPDEELIKRVTTDWVSESIPTSGELLARRFDDWWAEHREDYIDE